MSANAISFAFGLAAGFALFGVAAGDDLDEALARACPVD